MSKLYYSRNIIVIDLAISGYKIINIMDLKRDCNQNVFSSMIRTDG